MSGYKVRSSIDNAESFKVSEPEARRGEWLKCSNHKQRMTHGAEDGLGRVREAGEQRSPPKEDSESPNGFYGKRNRTGPMLPGFGLSDQSNPEVIQPGKC